MDLNMMANIAEIVGVLIVIFTIIFGFKQLQHYQLQREAKSAIELARYFQNPEFVCALRRIVSLTPEDFERKLQEDVTLEEAAMLVSLTVETIGLMVHRRMITLEMAWELMGGLLIFCWERLYPWVLRQRQQQGSEKFNEWTQWLIERMVHFEVEQQPLPAHKKYADWTPEGKR